MINSILIEYSEFLGRELGRKTEKYKCRKKHFDDYSLYKISLINFMEFE